MQRLARYLSTFFGVGFLPGAPGTWGSAAAALVLFLYETAMPGTSSIGFRLALIVLTSVVGVWAVQVYLRATPGSDDPSEVVIDEVAGVMVSALLIPWTPLALTVAFGAFRVFDIWKPFPVRNLEKLHGAFGVMADDLMAGVFALVVCQCVFAIV